jgi:PleD family two-component response regulator
MVSAKRGSWRVAWILRTSIRSFCEQTAVCEGTRDDTGMTRGTKRLRILVVDGHELVRRGIRDLLRAQRGWTIVGEAMNGQEAVEKTNKLKPHVAVLDIKHDRLGWVSGDAADSGVSPS